MAEIAAQDEAAKLGPNRTGPGDSVRLDRRYLIRLANRLPDLDPPGAQACVAEDRENPERSLYALICPTHQPVRASVIAGLTRKPCPNVTLPRAHGVVKLPAGPEGRFVIVFERPGGGPLSDHVRVAGQALTRQELAGNVLPPIIEALQSFEESGLTHRGIRPDNLFYTGSDRTSVSLGECCSAPPGYHQAAAYEPLESTAALPEARGEGSVASDLYALGVTILALVTGREPGSGKEPAALTAAKLALGSYAALAGGQRFEPAITALLVGLLCDEPERRWKLKQLRRWCDGLYDSTSRGGAARRALRSYGFMGHEYFQPALLAMALSRHPREALVEIREGRVERWLRSVLSDPKAADTVKQAAGSSSATASSRGAADAEMVTRTCLALDPKGPLRYRDLTITLSGLGPTIARAFADGNRDRLKILADLIRSPILIEAAAFVPIEQSRYLPVNLCTSLQSYMGASAGLGGGLEHCLYELNAGLACQSPVVADKSPMTLAELVRALDRSGSTDAARLLDRHIAAFLISRDRKFERSVARVARSSEETVAHKLALLDLLSTLQRHVRGGPLHGLTAAVAATLGPMIAELKLSSRRELLNRKLAKLAESGDIGTVLHGIAIKQAIDCDKREYGNVVAYFGQLRRAIQAIDGQAEARAVVAEQNGFWLATLIALGLLGISATTTLLKVFL